MAPALKKWTPYSGDRYVNIVLEESMGQYMKKEEEHLGQPWDQEGHLYVT